MDWLSPLLLFFHRGPSTSPNQVKVIVPRHYSILGLESPMQDWQPIFFFALLQLIEFTWHMFLRRSLTRSFVVG
jgi:hypothetical protein